jgi:DNA-binding NarL/FixJ family response regulator
MKVLIVEDEALIAMDLAMLVTDLGHNVCAIAASAAGAIAHASAHYPDVVLMDIRLAQGSSGIDAAREIHARQALRCIFLSANLDEPTRTALLPYDPVDFIGKPVLRIVLERALNKAQQGPSPV